LKEKQQMRNKKSRGRFDDQFRLEKLSTLKDPLENWTGLLTGKTFDKLSIKHSL
jgi:hypothetical protein